MKVAVLLFLALTCFRLSEGADVCQICQLVVAEVETLLSSNATETQILNTLATACNLFHDPTSKQQCHDFVQYKAPGLVQAIIAKETPTVACTQIQLCSPSSAPKKSLPVMVDSKGLKQSAVGGDVECGICTYLVGLVENYLETNATESEILALIEKDCTVLGDKSWVQTCQGLVATYGPEIIKLVIADQPASVVCTQIGLCSSTSKAFPVSPIATRPLADTGECDICQILVAYAEKLLQQNKTETEIVDALAGICDIIPDKDWSSSCHSLVIQYGSLLVQYLVNEEPPEVFCSTVGLCSSSTRPVQKQALLLN